MANLEKLKSLIPLTELEWGAQQQIYEALELDFLKTLAIMPDCHQGYLLPIGGVALAGKYGTTNTVLTFTPNEVLDPNTAYEIIIPAGGITDAVGNPVESTERFVFKIICLTLSDVTFISVLNQKH